MTHDHHTSDPHTPIAEPSPYYEAMEKGVVALLIDKGVITEGELEARIAWMEARNPAAGARVVARAWIDPEFRTALLADGTAACESLGIDLGGTRLMVVADDEDVHNVIVCTLCSCYPRNLLGLPPDWYKSAEYRSRVVREPRAVLAEFGTALPESTTVRVHDSSAELRYMVLPARPEGTAGWSEDQLAAIVKRDDLIGVTLVGATSQPTVA